MFILTTDTKWHILNKFILINPKSYSINQKGRTIAAGVCLGTTNRRTNVGCANSYNLLKTKRHERFKF